MSEKTTAGVRVHVRSQYVPSRSEPDEGIYFFTYTVTITNQRPDAIQLLTRHWIIADADGRTEEVRGPGVVGQQPILQPGESFRYTSFCPLPTQIGSMRGSYQMVDATGEHFDVEIPFFTLAQLYAIH
ncbi:MAG: Co2+/Mg2+ efflux protein ApaG [Myxococcales bacterium]